MLSARVPSSSERMSDRSGLERRSADRYTAERLPFVRVLVRPSFQAYGANLRDVSATGVGIICDRYLKPGAILAIGLQQKRAGVSGILSACVLHTSMQSDGTWFCGCRLSRKLTDDELLALQ